MFRDKVEALLVGVLVVFGLMPVARASADAWSAVAPMGEPRAAATATRLTDGEILVAGGYSSSESVGDPLAELFDPSTRSWRQTAPMHMAPASPQAALLGDGRVLVLGVEGCCGGTVEAETFDPETDSWSTAAAPAEMHDVETLTALPDGRLLAVGYFGNPGTLGAALYDPLSGAWSRTQPPLVERDNGETATLLGTGQVLLAGGYQVEPAKEPTFGNAYHAVLASAETYNPASGVWTPVAPMLHPRTMQAATAMSNGSALIAGGEEELPSFPAPQHESKVQSSAETFDPYNGTWQPLPAMGFERAYAEAATLGDGRVIVAGGGECSTIPSYESCFKYGVSPSLCCAANTAEIYEPTTEHWTVTGPVLAGNLTALVAFGNEALLAGGDLPLNIRELNSAYVYGPPPSSTTNSQPSSTPTQAPPPAPTLTHLRQSRRRWRDTPITDSVRRKSRSAIGTTFSFVLNEPATVELIFVKHIDGHQINHACVIETRGRHGRPCIRTISNGSLSLTGKAGENALPFDGRISHSHKLGPGDYTLEIKATNPAGQSKTNTLSFTIL